MNGEIIESQKQHLLDWIQRVFEKMTVKYDNVRKEIDEIMGGYILHTRTDDILEQGIQQGISQGIQQGISEGISQGSNTRGMEDAIRMSEDGLPVEKIALYVGESVETVKMWVSNTPVLA